MTTKEKLNAIPRLDRDGDIVERFLKFHDISSDRSGDIVIISENYGST